MDFVHIPVLLQETIEGLAIRPDGIYVDGTVGGAGHSYEIASRLTQGGRLIGLDRDPDAVEAATKRLQGLPATVVHCNYSQIREALDGLDIAAVDGILMDLGVSSHQLDEAERGFSYHADAPLDMRMSQKGVSAQDIVGTWSEQELARILRDYGEEKFAGRIAANIVKARETEPITRTGQLAEIVRQSVPQKFRRDKNPCKKTFQAIRIAVNDEFGHLRNGLEAAFECLKPGGRLAVITFHSLEDRIVKHTFLDAAKGCTCPKSFPICICGNKPKVKVITKNAVVAADEEQTDNPRARSAKLRVAEKL